MPHRHPLAYPETRALNYLYKDRREKESDAYEEAAMR